ncbi:MAG: hypothetical protein J5585_07730 [Clostridia bacterium]|nr:hypothetical protein [Clostridia bacterium]
MKRTKIRVIALVAFVILWSLLLASCGQKESVADEETSAVETDRIEVSVPEDEVKIDPIKNGDVSPDEIPRDKDIKVVSHTVKEIKKETDEEIPPVVVSESVETGQREIGDASGEMIGGVYNDDVIIAERIEQAKEEKEGVSKNPTVEKSVESEAAPAPSLPSDVYEDDGNGGAAPVFVDPASGGANPFAGGGSDVDEHNADEYVGEGDRPGEGIHF